MKIRSPKQAAKDRRNNNAGLDTYDKIVNENKTYKTYSITKGGHEISLDTEKRRD